MFLFQSEIPPQIENIDSLSLFLLATLAFITLTLIETSFILLFKRYAEFDAYRKYQRTQEKPCAQEQKKTQHRKPNRSGCNGRNVLSEARRKRKTDRPKYIFLSNRRKEYLHKSHYIDAACFIIFLISYVLFLFIYFFRTHQSL